MVWVKGKIIFTKEKYVIIIIIIIIFIIIIIIIIIIIHYKKMHIDNGFLVLTINKL